MRELIKRNKAVIVAADVRTLYDLENLVIETCDVEGIEGYKVGSILGLSHGLGCAIDCIKDQTDLPVIYDHQKGGTDIPELGEDYAKVVYEAGADAAILFPFGGKITAKEWIKACKTKGLEVIVGGHMTQKEFLFHEGGFMADHGPSLIYILAAGCGISNFVVPGNKPNYVSDYREQIKIVLGSDEFALWAPGFIRQDGIISEFAMAAGKRWRAIVGSAIYNAEDIRKAAEKITANIK